MAAEGRLLPQAGAFRAMSLSASTGGPAALERVLRDFRQAAGDAAEDFPPVFITQHLSAPFNGMLARRLSAACGIACLEAVSGAAVHAGHVYIAPDGAHLGVERTGHDAVRIRLMQTPPVHFCRPAVDPMLESLSAAYRENFLAVILTGMGKDGLTGCRHVAAAGGEIWIQDAQSSVVWGMPGAIAQSGLPCRVFPLDTIGRALALWAQREMVT